MLGNWDIFSLDINHAYQEPSFVVGVEFTNNVCFPRGISLALDMEEGLAL